jgi:bifunctional aspartate aminotransferase and glutamate/aspartate-prephenate aminotransferase
VNGRGGIGSRAVREKARTKKRTVLVASARPSTPHPPPPSPPQHISTGITRYTPNTGTAPLRAAIAAKLASENGLAHTPADIVVSNGAKQAIWQALLATCNPGDEVLIPAPYWVSYPEMARLAGAEPVILPSSAEDGFLLRPETLAAALTPKSRLLILCSPSNPSGGVYSKADLEALASVIAPHPRLLVLSDEIYEYIVYPPAVHTSFGSLPGMSARTLTVNGFSKAYAMTGWRLGYLAAHPPFAGAAAAIQSQSTSGASSIAQHAGLAALEVLGKGGGAPVAEMVAAFRERRDFVCARLRSLPGVTLASTPAGAFYALFDVSALVGPGASAAGFGPVPDVDALCRYFVEAAGVALVPGDAFGAPTAVRLSYAAGMDTLAAALDRLEAALGPDKYVRREG